MFILWFRAFFKTIIIWEPYQTCMLAYFVVRQYNLANAFMLQYTMLRSHLKMNLKIPIFKQGLEKELEWSKNHIRADLRFSYFFLIWWQNFIILAFMFKFILLWSLNQNDLFPHQIQNPGNFFCQTRLNLIPVS